MLNIQRYNYLLGVDWTKSSREENAKTTIEGEKKSKLMTYYFYIFIPTLFFSYSYFPLCTYSFFFLFFSIFNFPLIMKCFFFKHTRKSTNNKPGFNDASFDLIRLSYAEKKIYSRITKLDFDLSGQWEIINCIWLVN
jgi:hypothetical protein